MPWNESFIKAYWADVVPRLAEHAKQLAAMSVAERETYFQQQRAALQAGPEALRRFNAAHGVGPVTDREKEAVLGVMGLARVELRTRTGFKYARVLRLRDDVTQQEAARLLGVSVMTVGNWIRAKKLRGRRRSGFVVLRMRDIYAIAQTRWSQVPKRRVG